MAKRGGVSQDVAAERFKAYRFWNISEEEQEPMLQVQRQTGLKCASVTGPAMEGNRPVDSERDYRSHSDAVRARRFEPGTGDCARIMRVLRQINYMGYFDTEMSTSATPASSDATGEEDVA